MVNVVAQALFNLSWIAMMDFIICMTLKNHPKKKQIRYTWFASVAIVCIGFGILKGTEYFIERMVLR